MTPEIALLLAQDGITTGAIYVLVALGLVLIFLVTRVIFVPFGDVVGYAALTLAALQLKQTPGTVWLVLTLAALATAMEACDADPPRRNPAAAEGASDVRGAADPAGRAGLARRRARPADVARHRADARDRPADLAAALSHRVPAAGRRLRAGAADRGGRGRTSRSRAWR